MKAVSIISIIYGVLGLLWAAVVSVVIRFQRAMFENMPWPPEVYEIIDMPALMNSVYDVVGALIPFVFLGASLYIISGILQLTGKKSFKSIGYAAAIFNIVWYLAYTISVWVEVLPVLNSFEMIPGGVMSILFFFGTLFNAIFYCGYAIFLIIFITRGGKPSDTLQTGYTN